MQDGAELRARQGDHVPAETLASLTTFFRVAVAPADNNVCERVLKRAVLRKNALFYRTLRAAQAGNLFTTLIHTCQLCKANSFDYLTESGYMPRELAGNPSEWVPWNYRETIGRAGG